MATDIVGEMTHIQYEQFTRLFLSSEREIFRYVAAIVPNLHDAQDIVQETAVALWKKIDQYDPTEPFVPWACRFAVYEARSFARQSDRWRAFLSDSLAETLISRLDEMSDDLDQRAEYLNGCVERLPSSQQQIVRSYYYDRDSVEKVAESAGRSVEAIYKALQRIRKSLMACILRNMDTEGRLS
jgi:RNA polymerase sigma-70 factor (ECF subfamily)